MSKFLLSLITLNILIVLSIPAVSYTKNTKEEGITNIMAASIGKSVVVPDSKYKGNKSIRIDLYQIGLKGAKGKKIYFAFELWQGEEWIDDSFVTTEVEKVKYDSTSWEGPVSFYYTENYLQKTLSKNAKFGGAFFIIDNETKDILFRENIDLKDGITLSEDRVYIIVSNKMQGAPSHWLSSDIGVGLYPNALCGLFLNGLFDLSSMFDMSPAIPKIFLEGSIYPTGFYGTWNADNPSETFHFKWLFLPPGFAAGIGVSLNEEKKELSYSWEISKTTTYISYNQQLVTTYYYPFKAYSISGTALFIDIYNYPGISFNISESNLVNQIFPYLLAPKFRFYGFNNFDAYLNGEKRTFKSFYYIDFDLMVSMNFKYYAVMMEAYMTDMAAFSIVDFKIGFGCGLDFTPVEGPAFSLLLYLNIGIGGCVFPITKDDRSWINN
jgi:hypothetical protein